MGTFLQPASCLPAGQAGVLRLASCLCFCILGIANAQDNATIVNKANRLSLKGRYDESLALYNQALAQNPDSALAHYNKGISLYDLNQFGPAADAFRKALATDNPALESRAYYNLGNANFQLSAQKESEDLPGAVQLLDDALKLYKRAIDLVPADQAAKINYELTDKKLRELKDKLKQQPPQKQDQKDQSGQGRQQQNSHENQSSQDQARQGQREEQQEPQQQSEKSAQKQQQQEQEKRGQSVSEDQQAQKEDRQSGQEQENGSGQQDEDVSESEAKLLLEGYRNEENVFGKLNDLRQGSSDEPVKDW